MGIFCFIIIMYYNYNCDILLANCARRCRLSREWSNGGTQRFGRPWMWARLPIKRIKIRWLLSEEEICCPGRRALIALGAKLSFRSALWVCPRSWHIFCWFMLLTMCWFMLYCVNKKPGIYTPAERQHRGTAPQSIGLTTHNAPYCIFFF